MDCRHGLTLSILVLRKKSILFFVSLDGLTETISSFVVTGTLLRPISKSQKSHFNDATDFINFIEKKKKVKKQTFLVSVREMLRLILKEDPFQFNGKHYQCKPKDEPKDSSFLSNF